MIAQPMETESNPVGVTEGRDTINQLTKRVALDDYDTAKKRREESRRGKKERRDNCESPITKR